MEKVITNIEVQKKNKERVNIYVDGFYAFSCSAELVYTYGLKVKSAIDIESLQKIIDEDNYLKCKNSALSIIEKSYKSEKEVYDKLLLKGYDDKSIARAMEFLRSYNFVNDEAFIKVYIKDKIKSQGRNKIKYSLIRKGIDEKLILQELNEVNSEIELKAAKVLAEKKYKILLKSEKDYNKIYKKIWDILIRSGYDKEIANEVVSTLLNEYEKVPKEDKKDEKANLDELHNLAQKRYDIVSKSENDNRKLYKKLADFLLRRGYSWENIKSVLNDITKNNDFYE